MIRPALALLLATICISTLRAEQSDFYTAVELFKLSMACPFTPFFNPNQIQPIRGVESNQVTTDEQGITIIQTRTIDTHYQYNNRWNKTVQRDQARINFVDLQSLEPVRVLAPDQNYSAGFIPHFSLQLGCQHCTYGQLNFAVCDEARANNAKTALEALIALAKAGDGHLVGLPEPSSATSQQGCGRFNDCASVPIPKAEPPSDHWVPTHVPR